MSCHPTDIGQPDVMARDSGDELMSDPFVASTQLQAPAGFSKPGGIGGLDNLFLPEVSQPQETPDFLFPENFDTGFRRSWGERLTYHSGVAYLAGLSTGGVVGIAEGWRDSEGERRSIRRNKILNATGRKGPAWGNALGCVAMMWSIFEGIAHEVRGEDDLLNPVGAAALTGAIYKISAGPKVALGTGLGLGAAAAAGSFITKQLSQRGLMKSIF